MSTFACRGNYRGRQDRDRRIGELGYLNPMVAAIWLHLRFCNLTQRCHDGVEGHVRQ